MNRNRRLDLAFYGDDFTGSTDALEQLTRAGLRAALFVAPPSPGQIARFKNLRAIGVAGMTRSMTPTALERELRPAFRKLKALGARHVHYKVCSTFDSSPQIGSIGRVIDVATEVFRGPFVPLLVAAPPLGRYCVFGNLFARYGIGSVGAIHRLDRHPSISRHPVTPMTEADLRRHLGRQTRKRIGLLDVLDVSLPPRAARAALESLLACKPDVVLFDALTEQHLGRIGQWMDEFAGAHGPLFSVGSSGIEMALGAHWRRGQRISPASRFGGSPFKQATSPPGPILVGSGSCSPVTSDQIRWALKHGFAEIRLDPAALVAHGRSAGEIRRAAEAAAALLGEGRSVIVHTTESAPDRRIRHRLGSRASRVLGTALGRVLRAILSGSRVNRLCIVGGDTSSYAARALGVEALEMIASLTPGAPLCRAHAPHSPADQCEVVFKGGQVGAENYFDVVRSGRT